MYINIFNFIMSSTTITQSSTIAITSTAYYVLLSNDSTTSTYGVCTYNNAFYIPVSLYSQTMGSSSLAVKTVGYSIIFN